MGLQDLGNIYILLLCVDTLLKRKRKFTNTHIFYESVVMGSV